MGNLYWNYFFLKIFEGNSTLLIAISFFWEQKPDKTQADCRASARLVNGNTVCDSVIPGVRGVKGGNAGDGGDGGKSGECKHLIGKWP